MFNQWISRHRYSPVRSEDSEAATKPPLQIPVPRRVRTALGLALLMIVVFFFFRSPVLETRYHITTAAPTQYQNATLVPTTDCLPPGPEPVHDDVNWGDFAYVQYVTNEKYLCNSLMIFEALYRLNAKADLLMLYPQNWQVPDNDGSESEYESKLLAEARDLYKVILKPIEVRTYENKKDPTWEDSYTKLLVFEQTQYKRVILVDSDATILQHMDELFLLPPAPVAMPRAYWGEPHVLSSQVIVIEPSEAEWKRVEYAMEHHEGHDYDMDILNKLYNESATIIPHRKYDLLTGEFRSDNHVRYLGSNEEKWDARKILKETKYLHFSDWPMPKPWLQLTPAMDVKLEDILPKCEKTSETGEDCSNREVWQEIRQDFTDRRKRICGREYDN